MQRGEAGAKPKRARYHASVLDLEYLKAGHDFEELRKSYVIFITETDKYNQGEAIYPIERVNRVTAKLLSNEVSDKIGLTEA